MLKTKIGYWFQPKKVLKFIALIFIFFNISGCHKESAVTNVSENISLKKLSFNDLNGWNDDNFAEIIPVFSKNCKQLYKKGNIYLNGNDISSLKDKCKKFDTLNINSAEKMKKFMESE